MYESTCLPLAPSMEAIDFQFDTKLIDKVIKTIDKFREGPATTKALRACGLQEAIKECSGLTTELEIVSEMNAAVLFPKSLRNHPFFEEYMREYVSTGHERKDVKQIGKFSAGVDLRTGKVHGTIADHKHEIMIGLPIIGKGSGFSTRSVAAIIMHEVGHLFTFYEYANRVSSTNFLLTDIVDRVIKEPDTRQKMLIIKEATQEGLLRGGEKALLEAKTMDQARVVAYNTEVNRSRSDLGIDIYDIRAWEQLADQYASRFGLGRDLIAGLNKMEKDYGYEKVVTWSQVASQCVFIVIGSAFSVLALTTLWTAWLGALFLLGIGLAFCGEAQARVYDDPRKRFEVIRKEMIARLKTAPTKEIRKATIADIDAVDLIIADYQDGYGAIEFIQQRFYPSGRKTYRSIQSQQLLEDFANSELLLAASRLEQ